jgi:hypothetical protein
MANYNNKKELRHTVLVDDPAWSDLYGCYAYLWYFTNSNGNIYASTNSNANPFSHRISFSRANSYARASI